MKHLLLTTLLLGFLFFVGTNPIHAQEKEMNEMSITGMEHPTGADNVCYKWGQTALEATAYDTERFNPRPTITSRFLALIFTAVFDAWTRYDTKAIPVYLEGVRRRPSEERTLRNKEIAISYAALRTMNEYYYTDSAKWNKFMKDELGLDPDNRSMDPTTPVGIGNLAAKMVIEARKGDGANQYGEESGSMGKPYHDYTNYEPVNPVDTLYDLSRWQPKYFSDGMGGKFAPGCLTPYWQKVEPIALESADQFRPGPPPEMGSEKLKRQVKEVIDLQANLNDREKALVEFMRDGPKSVQQAGHWFIFAQDVSRRDRHTLDEDVKMYFANQVAAMDAFIANWDSKMYYDYARPYALVHHYYKDKEITCWGGPGYGMIDTPGQHWRPYSPATFLCPPFPAYTSGHSTVSGACSKLLELWTGSDEFGSSKTLVAGSLTHPENLGDTVTLDFPTFTMTAELAGISRVMGGYHIQADNVEGLKLGRKVGEAVYNFYLKHVGEAKSR